MGVANHLEQRVGLGLIVNLPVGVKDLVSAVLRVDLSKHEKLNVGGVSSGECIGKVLDLCLIKCKTKGLVSLRDSITGNMNKWFWGVDCKQVFIGGSRLRKCLKKLVCVVE